MTPFDSDPVLVVGLVIALVLLLTLYVVLVRPL
jgi:hypothetical protein